ncbi:PREDICTED: mechanosensitive ion channel protein 4-like [Tarenaya hassleriana]|uniref:mechanosensitive ion channel protein 4-like n=1 Tax=Tarenaya hassleriana TaxID=28532 RepID=UPI00053C68C0|nr:PREDICTED: mechanosensitive ion channel protein 4-like [Tarenaya hassleriana]XP_010535022.1 PREDICTED: mechanosensitive ion channel protein 4-like [Tarenaya hassleriana]XP_010535023.1 PREDICTED: mechanosensitive ion channel protein 4-like [Tarenaya hassleriana]
MAVDSADKRHVVVKINGDGGQYAGGFDFLGRSEETDPPSRLIDRFLHQQKASGEFSLDMDINMAELQSNTTPPRGLTAISESPSPATASYRETNGNTDAVRWRQSTVLNSPAQMGGDCSGDEEEEDEAEVVHCSSNRSLRNKTLLKTKTRSRLLDPPTPAHPSTDRTEMKSGRIRKSGFMGKSPKTATATPRGVGTVEEEEEEDPFSDEDLPEKFKKGKLSIWVLLEWISLILIVAGLVCILTVPYLRGKKLWNLDLWKWDVMILILICGGLVSSWIVRIVVFFIESNFLLRKRVLYFVYGIRKPVQNCLWLGLVLIAWHFLFDKKVERETRSSPLKYVTKALICLLVAVIIWLVKTLLVKVLASSFHMSTYFDRIQESLFTQYVIEALSGPPPIEIQRTEEEEGKLKNEVKRGDSLPQGLKGKAVVGSGRSQKSPAISRVCSKKEKDEEDGIRIDHLQRLNTKNVSAWRMKRLINIIRKGSLSTLDEQIQEATEIRSEYEAKLAARKIFQNVAEPGSKYIYFEDLLRFLSEEEAERAMGLFEGASESRRLTKYCLKNWVVNAFRERRALALTLNDTKTAVNKLHHIVNVLVAIVIAVISLLILGIATTKFLLLISSQLLLAAFVFGNSCKTIFEAIIFLFVMHPFDVGDRCEIDGVQMIVEEMNILTTVFLRYDNQKIVYPNSLLGTKSIANYYRSPDMGDAIEFFIHITTPSDKISAMKQRILSYVDIKKEHWYPAPMIVFKDMNGLNSVKIAVWLTHRMNHQDMGERWTRRGQLLEEMAKICRELDIQYRLYPLDINVLSFPQVVSDRLPPGWLQQHGN